MLEQNQLYRRIQKQNMFKTFSKMSTVKVLTDKLQSKYNKNHQSSIIYNSLLNRKTTRTALAHIRTQSSLKNNQINSVSIGQKQTSINYRQTNNRYPSLGQSMTLAKITSKLTPRQSFSNNFFINDQKNRKEGSVLPGLQPCKGKQNFWLKTSESKKIQHYENKRDEEDFSLLQLEQRSFLKKKTFQLRKEGSRRLKTKNKCSNLKLNNVFSRINLNMIKTNSKSIHE